MVHSYILKTWIRYCIFLNDIDCSVIRTIIHTKNFKICKCLLFQTFQTFSNILFYIIRRDNDCYLWFFIIICICFHPNTLDQIFLSQYSITPVFRKQINKDFLSLPFYDMINTISAKEYRYESDSF